MKNKPALPGEEVQQRGHKTHSPQVAASGDCQPKPVCILVVEDERIIARDLQATLQAAGYRVPATTASGEGAVLLAAELKPDLILMDIVLRGELDGVEAAERIRQQFGIPVIYLTSSGGESILERAKATEPLAFILKPYEEKDLLTTVDVALHHHKAVQNRAAQAQLATSRLVHDLNNVLSHISIAIPLLRESLTEKSDLQILDVVEATTNQGSSLLKQLLHCARSNSDSLALVELQPLLNEVGELLSLTLPKSIQSTVSYPQALWPIKANATQIYQIILNLCVNARDAMPEGGQLLLTAENVEMNELLACKYPEVKAGSYVVIIVGDTGSGIAPEILQKIFAPYFTTKLPGKGTGLGLATTRDIVKDHGGAIHVSSEVGVGTTFTLFLPASR